MNRIRLLAESIVNDLKDSKSSGSTAVPKSKLAIQLSLLALAVDSISKLAKLNDHLQKLEEKVFSETFFNDAGFDPKEVLSYLKLVQQTKKEKIEFLEDVLSRIEWSDLETSILSIFINNDKDSNKEIDVNNIEELAKQIVTKIKLEQENSNEE